MLVSPGISGNYTSITMYRYDTNDESILFHQHNIMTCPKILPVQRWISIRKLFYSNRHPPDSFGHQWFGPHGPLGRWAPRKTPKPHKFERNSPTETVGERSFWYLPGGPVGEILEYSLPPIIAMPKRKKWMPCPSRGENKKHLKPPPRFNFIIFQLSKKSFFHALITRPRTEPHQTPRQ